MFFDYFIKKFTRGIIGDFNGGKDPFTEEYELERKSFISGTTKIVKSTRPKTIHDYIPEPEQRLIRDLRRRSHRMELMFSFWGIKFGWINIVKLAPVVGDVFSLIISLMMLNDARKVSDGLPLEVQGQCIFNILIDFGCSLVPIVGDVVSVAWKPNCRNTMLLEGYLDQKYRKVRNVRTGSLRMGTTLRTAKQY